MAIKRFICCTLKKKIDSITVKWLGAFSCVWTLLIHKEIVLMPFVVLLQQSYATDALSHLLSAALPSLCPLDPGDAGITASKPSSPPLVLLMFSQLLLSPKSLLTGGTPCFHSCPQAAALIPGPLRGERRAGHLLREQRRCLGLRQTEARVWSTFLSIYLR